MTKVGWRKDVVVKIFATYISLVISRIGEPSFAIARGIFSWCTWENLFPRAGAFSLSLIDNAKVRNFREYMKY
jgi:hypothetical protein